MAKKRDWLWKVIFVMLIMTISIIVKQRSSNHHSTTYHYQNDSSSRYDALGIHNQKENTVKHKHHKYTAGDHFMTTISSFSGLNNDAILGMRSAHTDPITPDSLPDAYEKSASPNKIIVFSLISYGFRDMFMNFYLTSIAKHGITNVLFLATGESSCEILRRANFSGVCYPIRKDNSSHALKFLSKQFLRIMHEKTRLTLDMLERGYTVLAVDVDIVFLKNPLPYLAETCPKHSCDIAAQSNGFGANGGFVYTHPTNATLPLYREMVRREAEEGLDDQMVLNEGMQLMNSTGKLSAIILRKDLFPCGVPGAFFLSRSCPSREKYMSTIAVHNNWLYNMNDKILRFKECFMWEYGGDQNNYYAAESRKYIQYFPGIYGRMGPEALLNLFTLGALLNRTVILPNVLAMNRSRPVVRGNGLFALEVMIANRTRMYTSGVEFRESSFLLNSFVPDGVKKSLSPVYDITGGFWPQIFKVNIDITFHPVNVSLGLRPESILRWFDEEHSSVLQLFPVQYDLADINHLHYLGKELYRAFRPFRS